MTREEKIKLLRKIRDLLPEVSTDATLQVIDKEEILLGRPIADGELMQILTFSPECGWVDRDFYLNAQRFVTLLLDLYDGACNHIRSLRPPESAEKAKDYAAQCAMLCDKPAFQRFLFELHGLENQNKDAAASRVRSILNIQSRAELNDNPAAAEGWLRLFGEFEAWRKT